jgi:hypothetical protein
MYTSVSLDFTHTRSAYLVPVPQLQFLNCEVSVEYHSNLFQVHLLLKALARWVTSKPHRVRMGGPRQPQA